MLDGAGLSPFVSRLRRSLRSGVQVVLDAAAMEGAIPPGEDIGAATLFTPHAGEAARLLGVAKEEICGAPERFALLAAERWRSVVALKGSHTCVAHPDGRRWSHHAHCPGLGTSGSGDVLAGIIAGLAARGASLVQAAAWGVAIHARAGQRLSRRVGVLGFLARELLAEIPRAAADIQANDEGLT
jgi:NAD(P)H-hydrate repair Nnr-like enzyme with NAD(P)H-hydrate dehydratase domain